MKNPVIPCLAVAIFAALSACSNVADKTATTVNDTTTTVAHKTDPFAEDTTTTTTQKSLQQPVDAASSREVRDAN
jgi:hypothetical protein